MEKEFVSYEQAVALKELGFDEDCMANCIGFAYDFKDGEYITSHKQIFYPNDSNTPDDLSEELDRYCVHICGIPLKQQVFRWFRDKYEIHGFIIHYSRVMFRWCIDSGDDFAESIKLDTYEQAENGCIDELIKIAKQ